MANKNGFVYQFGDFRLDARACVLFCAGAPVSLKPKTIEILVALVENAGEVVSKDDLMNRVWKDTFVAENNLSVNVYALRKMFAEFGDGRDYIQTVPRRGFRFAPRVEKIFESSGKAAETPQVEQTAVELLQVTEDFLSHGGVVQTDSEQKILFDKKHSPIALPNLNFRRRFSTAAVLTMILFVAIGGSIHAWRGRQARIAAAENNLPPQNRIAERGSSSPEARDFYLRGYRLWQTRDNAQMLRGVEAFKRAIEIDPNFAAAYVGLADSFSMMENNLAQWRMAEEYADKALALAPDSAEARATKAFILAFNKWQWRAAEIEFKLALELDPDSGKAHQWYAAWLMLNRRFAEAETHLKRAIEIYPASPNYHGDLVELYFHDRNRPNNYAAVQEQCRRLSEVTVETPRVPACAEFSALLAQKRFDEAAQLHFQGLLQNGRTLEQLENSDDYQAYKAGGWRGWLKSDIARLENAPTGYNATYELCIKYAQLGDRENTFRMLEKARAERIFLLPFVNVAAEFDDFRDDPRFQDFIRRVGLNPI